MPKLVTKAVLRTRVRKRADMEPPDDFVSDGEIDQYLQDWWETLYAYLVGKYENHFVKFATQANIADYTADAAGLTAGEKDYYFPQDFWKPLRISIGSTTAGVGPWNDLVRAELASEHYLNGNDRTAKPQYYILHGRIDYAQAGKRAEAFRLVPTPDAAYSMRIAYIPIAPDIDHIAAFPGADAWLVRKAAIECLGKEESSVKELEASCEQILATIEATFIHKDAGQPQQVSLGNALADANEDYSELGW